MSKPIKWILIVISAILAAAFILPMLARRTGTGSKGYARFWRDQLLACETLDDVKQRFTWFEIVENSDGRSACIPDAAPSEGRPSALIQSFEDGKWVACVHSCTHGPRSGPGAGTAVSRDSEGVIRVYLGHICDRLWASGDTLEEFYSSLGQCYNMKEVELKQRYEDNSNMGIKSTR